MTISLAGLGQTLSARLVRRENTEQSLYAAAIKLLVLIVKRKVLKKTYLPQQNDDVNK